MTTRRTWPVALLVCACGSEVPVAEGTSGGDDASSTAVDPTTSSTSSTPVDSSGDGETTRSSSTDGSSSDEGPRLDMGVVPDVGMSDGRCAARELDVLPACDAMAPPDSFEPVLQWSWNGEDSSIVQVLTTPLVANLTDDNGDGEIDLCDVPDIIVVGSGPIGFSRMVVLDGATGNVHFEFPVEVSAGIVPAIGDIDFDGVPEVVAFQGAGVGTLGRFVALTHDGDALWYGQDVDTITGWSAIALADLDADGDVEISAVRTVIDHEGQLLWGLPDEVEGSVMGTAADLDDDGLLEVVVGPTAYRHDGTPHFERDDEFPLDTPAHVADVVGDARPEIVLVMDGQVVILDDDGDDTLLTISQMRRSEGTIHDVDGDGHPDLAAGGLAGADDLAILVGSVEAVSWSYVTEHIVTASAFDFLGDGAAEVLTADRSHLEVLGADGTVRMHWPRAGNAETPVVADVDADGSAEIVLVSAEQNEPDPEQPLVQVISDARDRWVPARRIWNQHGYHVTNVREDGTIPQVEPKHWLSTNTFRAQAQIAADGRICTP